MKGAAALLPGCPVPAPSHCRSGSSSLVMKMRGRAPPAAKLYASGLRWAWQQMFCVQASGSRAAPQSAALSHSQELWEVLVDLGADCACPCLPLVAGQPGWHRAVSVHLVEGDGDGLSHLKETAWHEAGTTERDMGTVLWAERKQHPAGQQLGRQGPHSGQQTCMSALQVYHLMK